MESCRASGIVGAKLGTRPVIIREDGHTRPRMCRASSSLSDTEYLGTASSGVASAPRQPIGAPLVLDSLESNISRNYLEAGANA